MIGSLVTNNSRRRVDETFRGGWLHWSATPSNLAKLALELDWTIERLGPKPVDFRFGSDQADLRRQSSYLRNSGKSASHASYVAGGANRILIDAFGGTTARYQIQLNDF